MSTLRTPDQRPLSRWHRAGNRRLAGFVVLVFGGGWLLQEMGILGWRPGWDAVLSCVLIALGAGLLATPRSARRIWPFVLGGLLVVTLAADEVPVPDGRNIHFGDALIRPVEVSDLKPKYSRTAGDLTLDLTTVAPVLPPRITRISVELGTGTLTVITPRDLRVRIRAKVGAGEVRFLGRRLDSGILLDTEADNFDDVGETATSVDLQIRLGAGEVNVR